MCFSLSSPISCLSSSSILYLASLYLQVVLLIFQSLFYCFDLAELRSSEICSLISGSTLSWLYRLSNLFTVLFAGEVLDSDFDTECYPTGMFSLIDSDQDDSYGGPTWISSGISSSSYSLIFYGFLRLLRVRLCFNPPDSSSKF